MKESMLKISVLLLAVIAAFSFATGCGKKTPGPSMAHHEVGSATLMFSEIYEECMANNDFQGAKDVTETYRYLSAFYCRSVYYEDVKNRNYNNMDFDVGRLQLAVAAYNEYNDESATDVEVDWICQFNSCSKEQHAAVDGYVEWYHTAQNGHYEGTIKEYNDRFSAAYNELIVEYGSDFAKGHRYDNLTPDQFYEVKKYMEDPGYQVDLTVWE